MKPSHRKVVAIDALPWRPPIISTIAWALLLDHLGASTLIWYVFSALTVFAWIAWLYAQRRDVQSQPLWDDSKHMDGTQ